LTCVAAYLCGGYFPRSVLPRNFQMEVNSAS
jgi:hypothetical protein